LGDFCGDNFCLLNLLQKSWKGVAFALLSCRELPNIGAQMLRPYTTKNKQQKTDVQLLGNSQATVIFCESIFGCRGSRICARIYRLNPGFCPQILCPSGIYAISFCLSPDNLLE